MDTGLHVGVRCVRGPDWKWGDQDGGAGHVGTVVLLGHKDNPHCLPGSVMVVWDNGFSNNYHTGRSNLYDLRLFDNGPTGAVHDNILCSGCSRTQIFGIRWTCNQCMGVHLCSRCYHLKFHDLTHDFTRYLHAGDHGVKVACRAASQQTEVFGIFRGAVVMRGVDWDWGDQDGGQGSQGIVKEIVNWNDQTGNSVACVIWSGSKENLYRVGHKSKVDIRYVKRASGGKIYLSHLPLVGKPVDICNKFEMGERVEVCVDLITLQQLQIGHGEYREEMAKLVGRKGRVHRLTEKGDVRVQFPTSGDPSTNRWTLNPMALRVVKGFDVGDKVKITDDRNMISKYHTNHAALSGYAGHTARIQHIHGESSVTLDVGNGRVVTMHPALVQNLHPQSQHTAAPAAGAAPHFQEHNHNERFIACAKAGDVVQVEQLLSGQSILPDNEAILTGLHKAAGLGYVAVVTSILKFRPVLVNQKLQGKTLLMMAAYKGYVEMIKLVVVNGGDGCLADQVGDMPIHYAAIGCKPQAILTLVDKGSPVNVENKENRTPLHQAVIGRNMETVTALLKVGAAVNIQDVNGETPLQVAINMKCEEIASCMVDQADLLVFEKNGWNSLHLAVRAGLTDLVSQLLRADRRCVNIVTRDGQAPLHIAIASGNISVVKCLLETAECDVNIQDSQGRTGLHYASLSANLEILTLLLNHRCNLNTIDYEGNTASHLAMLSATPASLGHHDNQYRNELDHVFESAHIERLTQLGVQPGEILRVGVLLTLLQRGADRDITNNAGESPIHVVHSPDLQNFIIEYLVRPAAAQPVGAEHDYAEILENVDDARGGLEQALEALEQVTLQHKEECKICGEDESLVTFDPCGHKMACNKCAVRMKNCLQCNSVIQNKTTHSSTLDKKGAERLLSLEQKFKDLEEQFLCSICLERKRNVAFLCGHGACAPCTQDLVNCHMCRNKIEKKIPLY